MRTARGLDVCARYMMEFGVDEGVVHSVDKYRVTSKYRSTTVTNG